MGLAPSMCGGDAKFRFKKFVLSVYEKDAQGQYISDEEALSKLKSYAARNPERVPRICRKIGKIMHRHLSHDPPQVQRVLISVKSMYALIEDAVAVDVFVPYVVEMAAQLFATKRYPFYMGGADLLTVLCMKLVETNAHPNTRRLLKDHSNRLLPPLLHMISSTTLLSHSGGSPEAAAPGRGSSKNDPKAKAEARASASESPVRSRSNAEADGDAAHLHLTHDPRLSKKVTMLSGGLIAIGNMVFCVPDMAQDLMQWRTLKIIVLHVLHTVRHGVFLQRAAYGRVDSASQFGSRQPSVASKGLPRSPGMDSQGTPASSSFVPRAPALHLPKSVLPPRNEGEADTLQNADSTVEQEHLMLVVQQSALHALRSLASSVHASGVDHLIRMVLECFEEDGEDGAWGVHAAVDLVFHALARSLETQSQKLGMCLCTAVAYVILLGQSPIHHGPPARLPSPLGSPSRETTHPPPTSALLQSIAAAAAAARPPVLPEQIPKAFASPSALGGLLRALHQCLLVIPMTGARPHVFLGAIQVLLSETSFLTHDAGSREAPHDGDAATPFRNARQGSVPSSPVSPSNNAVSSDLLFTTRQRYAFLTEKGCLTAAQPLDVVLLSLTTALLGSIHQQQNFPALHLVLNFLVEVCSDALGGKGSPRPNTEADTGALLPHNKGSGRSRGRRVRLFMLRLLQSTAAYFRALPDSQRWDVDLFLCIEPILYDLRHPRNVVLATSALCQLLAGQPPTRRMFPSRRTAPATSSSPDNAANATAAALVRPPASSPSSTRSSGASGALHTSQRDVERATQWMLCVSCTPQSEELTPSLLVALGHSFAACISGYGVYSIPFVLRTCWYLYARYGGRCEDTEGSSPASECHEDSKPLAKEETLPQVRSVNQCKAWHQVVLAVLSHLGVLFNLPELVAYIVGVWEARREAGELCHWFLPDLQTRWEEGPNESPENVFVRCGLQLTPPPPTSPTGNRGSWRWGGEKPFTEAEEEEAASPLHPASGALPRVPLSFPRVARLLAGGLQDLEAVFGCEDLAGDGKQRVVDAIALHCFSAAAVESLEAAALSAAREVDGSPRSPSGSPVMPSPPGDVARPFTTEEEGLHSPLSAGGGSPDAVRTPESDARLHTALSGSGDGKAPHRHTPLAQLSSLEYLSVVEDISRSAQRRSQHQSPMSESHWTAPHEAEPQHDDAHLRGQPSPSSLPFYAAEPKVMKFAVGDREKLRKTLVSFDRKDIVGDTVAPVLLAAAQEPPAASSEGNHAPASKLAQWFEGYRVDPTDSIFDLRLFTPPQDRVRQPTSPRTRLAQRLNGSDHTEDLRAGEDGDALNHWGPISQRSPSMPIDVAPLRVSSPRRRRAVPPPPLLPPEGTRCRDSLLSRGAEPSTDGRAANAVDTMEGMSSPRGGEPAAVTSTWVAQLPMWQYLSIP